MSHELPQTSVISVADFEKKWIEALPFSVFERCSDLEQALANRMNVDLKELENLAATCDPSRLTCDEELRGIDEIGMLSAPELFSVDFILEKFPRTKAHLTYDYHLLKNYAEDIQNELKEASEKKSSEDLSIANKTNNLNVPYNLCAILVVHVFVPFSQRHRDRPCFSQEILVLSSQTLADLRDAIRCPCDSQRVGEFSNNPDSMRTAPLARDVFPSSYFYIENNFYNDFRHSCNDLSVCVRQWMLENGAEEPGSYSMSKTKFGDIKLSVGRPYLYLHFGNCEHIIVFADLRMISPDDIWEQKKYPIMLYYAHGRIDFCFLCDHLYACWIVYNSKLVIDDPCLLCEPCFRKSHYDIKGKPIGNFQAYHFSQHS